MRMALKASAFERPSDVLPWDALYLIVHDIVREELTAWKA